MCHRGKLAITVTYEIEASGSRWPGEVMVSVFVFIVVCVGFGCCLCECKIRIIMIVSSVE